MDLVLREGAFLGETHIVTGAAQGIGFAIAQALALHGAQVAMVDLDAGRLEEAKAKHPAGPPEQEGLAARRGGERRCESGRRRARSGEILEATGCINGLVNVAGHHARLAHHEEDPRRLQPRAVGASRRHLPVHARGRRPALASALQGEGRPAPRRRRESLHRELLVRLGAKRQRRAGRLHRGQGRDRGGDAHDGAGVLELPRARERDRAGTRQYADARGDR